MPIQVDREGQRAHVTSLAAGLVAREGVAALTFRRVAEAAGSSTAIVSTYFTDKRDLLLSTFRAAASRTTVRFEAAIAAGGSLRDCLEAWLPLDADRLTDWRVILAFWGVAVADPDLAAIQDGHVSRARARVERLLRAERGEGPPRGPEGWLGGKHGKAPDGLEGLAWAEDGGGSQGELERVAQQILALTLGIALQAVFEPGGSGSLPQRALLADGLTRLTQSPH
jgi:AcrR family transcriptional regulator